MKKIIFITGGARSGKSMYAEKMAGQLGNTVAYVATAEIRDEEMKKRVFNHRLRRPCAWLTVEEPIDTADAIRKLNGQVDVILVDCLTLFCSNWLLRYKHNPQAVTMVLREVDKLIDACREISATVIVVSNEVGHGIVSEHLLARLFCDISGLANQRLATCADSVILMVAGIPMPIKSIQ